jgi:hypothetical protein
MKLCPTCDLLMVEDELGPLCAVCDDEVRNPKVAAHLLAHEAGLNKRWLDAKQKSRERWFRRKGNWRGELPV